jgi:glycosyltransferase involved in cell wall biosynthesis
MLVEPGDVTAFADALESYARDPELRKRHGEAGLAHAKTQDWDEINAAVLRVYAGVLERRGH